MTVDKARDAFLTIGELSAELGVPQHVLRYWETRFAALRPLTRAGNRRYYRPQDVALARQIAVALNDHGYTIKGVQKLLAEGALPPAGERNAAEPGSLPPAEVGEPVPPIPHASVPQAWITMLHQARDRLARAVDKG